MFKMEEIAKNIIKDHKAPLTKINLIGPKLFFNDSSANAQEFVSKNMENLENALKHKKVDKRCARAQAEWDPSLNLAKVNKVVKGLLENFGFQDKTGIYMYPEEMLFLVETNRMEVFLNDVPLSIQECFDIFLNIPKMNLNKYRVYKKLVMKGCRVVRECELKRKQNKYSMEIDNPPQPVQNKRTLEDETPSSSGSKKMCSESTDEYVLKTQVHIEQLFDNVKACAPRRYISRRPERSNPDFFVFLQTNTSRVNWDFNVYICDTYAVDALKFGSKKPSIHAICCGDNISFYKLGLVDIPDWWM